MLLKNNQKYLLEIPVSPTPQGELPNQIVKVFADNGTLGFLFLTFFVAAYLLDLKGFLADIRLGFKALNEIAHKLDALNREHEKSINTHDKYHEELINKLDKLEAHIERNYDRLHSDIKNAEPCVSFKRSPKQNMDD